MFEILKCGDSIPKTCEFVKEFRAFSGREEEVKIFVFMQIFTSRVLAVAMLGLRHSTACFILSCFPLLSFSS